MKETEFKKLAKAVFNVLLPLVTVLVFAVVVLIYLVKNPTVLQFNEEDLVESIPVETIDDDRIENGIHLATGLKDGKGLLTVVRNCTGCHSAKLITQNRMNRERWVETIRWMQNTQNLPDLGGNETVILDYLVNTYPVEKKGRREPLKDIVWYELED